VTVHCLAFCPAVINLVKFVLSNESVLVKKFDVFVLCTRVSWAFTAASYCCTE